MEECLRAIVIPMRTKFSKYWDECCVCLAVAVILDPRYKMDITEYYYDKLYGEEFAYIHVQKIKSSFFDLYIEYGGRVVSSQSSIIDGGYDELISNHFASEATSQRNKSNDFKRWRQRERESGCHYIPKSEFDQYLDEETHPCTNFFLIF